MPESVLRIGRRELDGVSLPVIAGALPPGLGGSFFVVAPAGTVASGGRPSPAGEQTSLLDGDGLVCRLDFGPSGVTASSRLARPPCERADELTHEVPELALLRFLDAGIARLSPLLGARNFLNTAFVPMCAPGEPARLLVTYDAGRPFEIDPATLEVVTPVGAQREWRSEVFSDQPFPMVLSPGHPGFDPATGELFSINYGRSIESLFGEGSLLSFAAWLPRPIRRAIARLLRMSAGSALEQKLIGALRAIARRFAHRPRRDGLPQEFTDLVRWDGRGPLQRWRLTLDDGSDVAITQSVHQVAVTRHYLLFHDIAFRVGVEQWFNDPLPHFELPAEILRALTARPQRPDSVVYVVRRDELERTPPSGSLTDPARIHAKRVVIPVESAHLLADYDDADDQITFYLSHCAATDLSEWVRPYDRNYYDCARPPELLQGMVACGAMDVNRVGRYVVDGASGQVRSSRVAWDDRATWTIALYAGRELPTLDRIPEKLEQLYWSSAGFFPELLTRFVHDLYRDYPYRLTPLAELDELAKQGGRPACLFRLDTRTMTIADRHELPQGHMTGSVQFVPSEGGGATDGWLVAMVFTPARTEVWIYDAARLSSGPICRLDASALGVGFTIHTAWLAEAAPRRAPYRISLADDLPADHPHEQVRALLDRLRR
ncbi:MAG TPA: carotenoid oxygenase family protein [Polyangia bacterium]